MWEVALFGETRVHRGDGGGTHRERNVQEKDNESVILNMIKKNMTTMKLVQGLI